MSLRNKGNNRTSSSGGKKKTYSGALPGVRKDDVLTIGQLENFLNGRLVTAPGQFTNFNANQAIEIKTVNGFVYLPILIYP